MSSIEEIKAGLEEAKGALHVNIPDEGDIDELSVGGVIANITELRAMLDAIQRRTGEQRRAIVEVNDAANKGWDDIREVSGDSRPPALQEALTSASAMSNAACRACEGLEGMNTNVNLAMGYLALANRALGGSEEWLTIVRSAAIEAEAGQRSALTSINNYVEVIG